MLTQQLQNPGSQTKGSAIPTRILPTWWLKEGADTNSVARQVQFMILSLDQKCLSISARSFEQQNIWNIGHGSLLLYITVVPK